MRLGGCLAACPALAQKAPAPKVTIEELMAPNALPDIVQGKADAPVTIVEYASMTWMCVFIEKGAFMSLAESRISSIGCQSRPRASQ